MTSNKLLLFVVETVVTCQSDVYYLTHFIKKSGFFDFNSWKNASIQFVYLNGKTNYKSNEIKEEIANLIWAIQILFRSFIDNIFDCQVLDNLNLVINSPKIFFFCFPISWIKSIRKNNIAFWNLMQSF